MRVGTITDSIDRGHISIRNYTKNLIENLVAIVDGDVEFVLIHSQKSDDPIYERAEELILPRPPEKTPYSFFALRVLSFVKRQFSEFAYNYKVQSEILNAGIDIIHIPHLGRPAPPFPFIFLKTKFIVTNHGMAQLSLPPNLCYGTKINVQRVLEYKEFLKWKFLFKNNFNLIITVSESEKRTISQKLSISEEKIKVIYHGVANDFKPLDDIESIRKQLNGKYGIGYHFILHVSAYQPKKNTIRLIRAFHKLKLEHKLVIVGNQGKNIKEMVKNLGLQDKIIFPGFIDNKDLISLYNAADLFAFPSLHESFGMPILEAMACGTPVITSNVFSMPEVAGDAAVLVDPYNLDEIANAMYKVLTNDGLREELIKKGLKRAKQFSWRKCAEEHLKVYNEVISQ